MKITEINIDIKKVAVWALLFFAAILIYKASSIILLFLFSVFLAYLMNPFVNFLERCRIPRLAGALILMLILAAMAFTVVALMLPVFIENIVYLIKNMPVYVEKAFMFLEKLFIRFDISFSLNSLQTFIMERLGVISQYALSTVTTAAASVKDAVMIILNAVIIPILVFLLLKDFPQVKKFTGQIVERFHLQKFMGHAHDFEGLMGKYFRGMFLVGLILSALYSIVLIIVGVKTSILLGLITGMGVLIPYIGFAVGLVISLIMTAIQFHDVIHVVYVLIGFCIVQFMESFLITPKIVGNSLGLNPIIVIIGLMIGGTLFGFFGMILALPVTAFLKILMNKYLFNQDNKEDK